MKDSWQSMNALQPGCSNFGRDVLDSCKENENNSGLHTALLSSLLCHQCGIMEGDSHCNEQNEIKIIEERRIESRKRKIKVEVGKT